MRLFRSICLLVLGTAAIAGADTLVLKSGETVQGTYMGGTARQIRIEISGEVRTYDIGQVQSVTFQSDGPYLVPQADSRTSVPSGQPVPPVATDAARPATNAVSAGVTLDAGTQITVRMIDSVDSETARLGQTFRASIDEPVTVGSQVVIPRGADVLTKLVDDKKSGKIQGRTVLTLALVSITVNGQPVDVTTSDVQTASGSRGAKSAKVVGGTTALGAIIGGLAGGGRGAAIGAASGAAAGTGAQVVMGGEKVKIPSETRLTFRLQNPAQI
jgi:hypothetical protein